jgi:hypothetical protein
MDNSFYKLLQAAYLIEQKCIDSDGEISDEDEKAITTIERNLSESCDDYAFLLEKIDHASLFWKQKADKAVAVSRGLNKLYDRIKDSLKQTMEVMQLTSIEGRESKYRMCNNRGRLVISDETKIPDCYKIVSLTVNKERLRGDLEKGIKIDGARIEFGTHLLISANRGIKE